MSSSTQALIQQLNLGNTFGALFIGVIIAAILFGVTNVQAFIYFQTHRDTGRTFYKLVVIGLWILDALHLALIVHCVYYYLVNNYGNIGALTEIVWSFKLQIIIDVVLIYGVHIMYTYRIWIVSRGRSRTLPIIVVIIMVLVSGPGVGEDSIVLLLLAHHFYLTLVAGWSIIFSIITVITCAAMPRNFIFLGIEFLVTKLYVNSYLALLNARYYFEAGADTINSSEYHVHHRVPPGTARWGVARRGTPGISKEHAQPYWR
ncbi:hypothetical protein DFH29DRAFT_1074038 [Suillus ampliporus]|nr:hypothetical protein DFH29DRAFT_1074038 [Suillus ampliporus]